jgi:hypothetical protein
MTVNLPLVESIAHTLCAVEQPLFIRGLPDVALGTTWRQKVADRLKHIEGMGRFDSTGKWARERRRLLLHLNNVVVPDPFGP